MLVQLEMKNKTTNSRFVYYYYSHCVLILSCLVPKSAKRSKRVILYFLNGHIQPHLFSLFFIKICTRHFY